MSTSDSKRLRRIALEDAEAFKALFPAHTYTRWEFAGSLRRQMKVVGDVEHVIEPVWGDVEVGTGLFVETVRTNLLLHRLDELYRASQVAKHVYPNGTHRWREKYRGVSFRGFAHELFTATAENWGLILLIRTGPAEYSREVVDRLRARGTPSAEGYIRQPPAPGQVVKEEDRQVHPAGSEREVLTLAGMPWLEPWERQ